MVPFVRLRPHMKYPAFLFAQRAGNQTAIDHETGNGIFDCGENCGDPIQKQPEKMVQLPVVKASDKILIMCCVARKSLTFRDTEKRLFPALGAGGRAFKSPRPDHTSC